MDEASVIAELKKEGYGKVYAWHATPGENDPAHTHPFDTKLVILEGELEIILGDKKFVLRPGDSIEVPQDQTHAGIAGTQGCTYIVAEEN